MKNDSDTPEALRLEHSEEEKKGMAPIRHLRHATVA